MRVASSDSVHDDDVERSKGNIFRGRALPATFYYFQFENELKYQRSRKYQTSQVTVWRSRRSKEVSFDSISNLFYQNDRSMLCAYGEWGLVPGIKIVTTNGGCRRAIHRPNSSHGRKGEHPPLSCTTNQALLQHSRLVYPAIHASEVYLRWKIYSSDTTSGDLKNGILNSDVGRLALSKTGYHST